MLRAFATFTAALALVGPVHAQERIAVSVAGKSPQVVRAALYRAALTVCQSSVDMLNPDIDTCLHDSLDNAMDQFNHIQRLQAVGYTPQTTR